MRIAIVTPYFGAGRGGVESYVAHLGRGLTQSHEVVVVTLARGRGDREPQRGDDLRVRYLPYRWKLSNTPVGLGWSKRLRRILEEEAPDVINAHLPVPGLADVVTRVAGRVPVVLTYHNDVVKDGPLSVVTSAYHLAVGRRTLAAADRVIATSPTYARQSKRLRHHLHHLAYAPPGVDPTVFHPGVDTTAVRERFAGERLVLFVGNLAKAHAHKGLDVLIQAMAVVGRAAPARLVVVGRGDGLQGYLEMAARCDPQRRHATSFVGAVTDAELAAYYAAAEVLVLPSTTASEGFGMVLAEAQACGTPVIGSRIGGIPAAFVDGRSGLAVTPGSVDGLAASLLELLGAPELRARLARGAVEVAPRFTWPRTVAAHEAVFRQVGVRPVVHVSTYFPPFLGGLERVVERTASATAGSGLPCRVLTSSTGSAEPGLEVRDDGLCIRRLRAVSIGGLPILPALFFHVLTLRGRPVLHTHYSQAGLVEVVMAAARLRGLPVVVHHHLDVRATGRFGVVFEWYRRHILPGTLRRAQAVIVFSPGQAREMAARGVRASRVRVIPNGVDVPAQPPEERTVRRPPRIVFVGRLVPQKQVDTLLRALIGVSGRFDTRIIGDGELRAELEGAVSELRLENVRFTGALPPGRVRAELRAADVFVLPSEREGMPLALLEAMAEGAIVVASDVTGTRDIIDDGANGMLFDVGDAVALRRALLALEAGRADAVRLRRSAYATACHYSFQTTVEGMLALYREVSGIEKSA